MIENNWLKRWQDPEIWVMGIAGCLMAAQLILTSHFKQVELSGTSLMAWGSAAFLIWDKQTKLEIKSNTFWRFFGATFLALILIHSLRMSQYSQFLRFSPLLSGIGLTLLLSGWVGFKQFWQELVMLFLPTLSPAPAFLVKTIDITIPTAKVSTMLLWYLGYPVTRQGVFMHLPTGSVEVGSGCSGLTVIIQLIGLGILVLFMFPSNLKQKILVPIAAIVVGFLVNAVRVGVMAVLAASSNPKSFEYWHFGEGSVIFSMIAVTIFGLLCWFVILREEPANNQP